MLPSHLFRTLKYRRPVLFQCKSQNLFSIRSITDKVQTTESNEVYSVDEDLESYDKENDFDIEAKRNKSRLRSQDLNILHGRPPYGESKADFHNSLNYKRRMFGRYGMESNVDPGSLWPNKEEINEALEYERVAYPKSVLESVEMLLKVKEKEQEEINERQSKIAQNMTKLEQWKKEIADRSAKRLAEATQAKAKKDALIEEVRRHFGFKIDPKDERFKEVLLQKEKEQKKKMKQEKAKAKQERLLAIMNKSETT